MKILVGWWNLSTGQLVDIPGFDRVTDPTGWAPAIVEVHPSVVNDLLDAMAKAL